MITARTAIGALAVAFTTCAPSIAGVAGGGVALLLGDASGAEVRVYDENTGAYLPGATNLRGIRLLPIDFNGRTTVGQFLPDRPRYVADVPGASRLILPGGKHVLYHYRREDPTSGEVFYGFLAIDAAGAVLVRGELPGAGAFALDDPYIDVVSVAQEGDAFLAATTAAAGGDLLEIALDSGVVTNRTANLPAMQFTGSGLALRRDWGIGIGKNAVLRFARQSGALAEVVPFEGGAPTFLSGELVVSNNGQHALTTGGASATSAHPFAFGQTGNARCASSQAAPVSPAGFLPDHPTGPFMAVSDDGSVCAWRIEGASRELFTARIAAAAPPTQVTENGRFLDTLDEVGVVGFVTPDQLVMGVGEAMPAPLTGLEKFDLFTVTVADNGTSQTLGLTQSTGEVTEPFLQPPNIKPLQNVYWIPSEQGYLLHDDAGAAIVATHLAQPGLTVVDADVKDLDFIEPHGADVVVAIRRDTGSKPWQMLRVPAGMGQSQVIHSGGSTSLYVAPHRRAAGPDTVTWIWTVGGTDVAFQRLRAGASVVESTRPTPPQSVTLGFSPSGGVTLSARAGYFVWHDDGRLVQMLAPVVAGRILPGP